MVNDMALRFRYRFATPQEEQAELDDGGDGICYNGENNFIRKVIQTKDLVYMDVPFW